MNFNELDAFSNSNKIRFRQLPHVREIRRRDVLNIVEMSTQSTLIVLTLTHLVTNQGLIFGKVSIINNLPEDFVL